MALQGGRAQGGLELGREPRKVGDPGQLLRRRSVDTDQSTQELGPEAKRRASAKVEARAPRDRGSLGPRRFDQLRGDSGLADPSLSGESGDAAMACPGLTPDLDQTLELGDPARERVTVTEWHRIIALLDPGHCPLRSGRVRSAEVTSQSPRLLGRADPELGAKTRSKLVVGGQHTGPVTGGGKHPHQVSRRLELGGLRPKRRPQGPEGAAKAGPRARVEHLGPKAPRELSARVKAAI